MLQARYYDGSKAEFLSEDPVFQAIGSPGQIKQLVGRDQQALLSNPQALNSYSYAQNNPVTTSDPKGLLGPETPFEAAFATPAGFILGFIGQGLKDYYGHQLSPYEDYVGSMVGGAVTLNVALDSDGLGAPASSAIGAGVGNATTQALKNINRTQRGVNVTSALTDVGLGYAFGYVPDAYIASRSYGSFYSGSNTFSSLSNQLRAVSAAIAVQVARGSPSTVSQGVVQGLLSQLSAALSSLSAALSAPASASKKQ